MIVVAAVGCGRSAAQTEQPPEFFSEADPYEIEDVRPASSSPNVIVWVVDDLGFGQVGAFGGVIETPTLDALAASGLIYTNYHTTPI